MENVDSSLPKLEELLPQASPMILLSGFYPPSDDALGVSAWIDVARQSPFYDDVLGKVSACAALEYMAQAMALCIGIYRFRNNLAPKIGFVLGSRRLEIFVDGFEVGKRYTVSVTPVYSDESFGSFSCEVADDANNVVARAEITAFQPDNETENDLIKGKI